MSRVLLALGLVALLVMPAFAGGGFPALAGPGQIGDEQTSIIYYSETVDNNVAGTLVVDAPASTPLTSFNIDSAGSLFLLPMPPAAEAALVGSFDNYASDNIFKATFGSSFGTTTLGVVLPAGLSFEQVQDDLSAVGSLQGGGALGPVDLVVIPEPSALVLLGLGLIGLLVWRRR